MFGIGVNNRVYFNQYDLSAYLKGLKTTRDVGSHDITTFGAAGNAKQFLPGLVAAVQSFEGFFAGDAADIDSILSAAFGQSQVQDFTTISLLQQSVGSRCRMFQVFQTKYDVGAPVAEVVMVNVDLVASGVPDAGIILHPVGAETATSSGASVDNAASSAFGGAGHLHVLGASGSGASLIAKVQHSADNSSWADLLTFTAVSGLTPTSERKEFTGTVNRYVRAAWTIAGAAASYNFALAFARRIQ